jgi:nitrogen fixation NifU-like protein
VDDLYREVIIEHYNNPSHRGILENYNVRFEDNNPLCGDHIEITLLTDSENRISDAKFDGHGCSISQATADILLDYVINKDVEEVKKMTKDSIIELIGIEPGPVRLKCALLSLKVLKAGIYGLTSADEIDLDE